PVEELPLAPTTISPAARIGVTEILAEDLVVEDDRNNIRPGDPVLLIIEDDITFARILVDMAHSHNIKAVVALRGATALSLAKEFKPGAVTLDISLPDMVGWTLLDRLKHDPATRHIPVHVISGLDDERRSLQYGALGFLPKPVTVEGLQAGLSGIRAFVEKRVKNLLVVEDDPVQSQAIADLIGDGDVVTTSVASGEG